MAFNDLFLYITFCILSVVHYCIFGLFWFSVFRIVAFKYTPYTAFYIASVVLAQALYNGCPIVDIQNYSAYTIGISPISNEFWDGIFGEYTGAGRVLSALTAVVLYYYSYKFWYKPRGVMDFSKIVIKSENDRQSLVNV